MNKATMTERATANPASAEVTTGRDAPGMGGVPTGSVPTTKSSANGAPMDESPTGEPPVNGAPVDGVPINGVPLDEAPMGPRLDGTPMGEPPVSGVHESESAAPDTYAVKMTAEEWERQQSLMAEYIPAITRDRKRAAELRRQIIFPSFILKSLKRLSGASYIRKHGLNTVDADLVYGPGWLDEDDGGPLSMFAEGYKGRRRRNWT